MTLSDQLLAALLLYGLPVLFVVILVASVGIPLPASLLLITAGSFVEQGQLNVWAVIGLTAVAAIGGDNISYGIGRWGGRHVINRMLIWIGGDARLRQAEAAAMRWGGPSIFLSRWLVPPLGPPINIASGIAGYSWPAFLFFDVAGEIVWVSLYVSLGRIFSNRVQAMNDLVGDLGWVLVGLVAVLALGWKFAQYLGWRRGLQTEGLVPASDPTSEHDEAGNVTLTSRTAGTSASISKRGKR